MQLLRTVKSFFSQTLKEDQNTFLYYLASFGLLCLYGIQVCPFVDDQNPAVVIVTFYSVMLLQWGSRQQFLLPFIRSTSYEKQVAYHFWLEWLLFVFFGTLYALFNMLVFEFPFESGAKILVGFIGFGFYISMLSSLNCEYDLVQFFYENAIEIPKDVARTTVAGRFRLITLVSLFVSLVVITLLLLKDFMWMVEVAGTWAPEDIQRAIAIEMVFVISIMFFLSIRVINRYSMNIQQYVSLEKEVLKAVSEGDFAERVPVASSDEFGDIARYTNQMTKTLEKRNDEIQRTQDITILCLASLAETRDNETGMHIRRTQHYVECLADQLRYHPEFAEELTDENIESLFKSAPLHDIGKVGIPDSILLKPGRLTEEEFEIMKNHTVLGEQAIQAAIAGQEDTSFLKYAREIAAGHHEKWDGSGYPNGLSGDEIPLSARLMAVADVYDALISRRVYKAPIPHDEAIKFIIEGRGKHFDPRIVDALLTVEQQFIEIAEEFADERSGDNDEYNSSHGSTIFS